MKKQIKILFFLTLPALMGGHALAHIGPVKFTMSGPLIGMEGMGPQFSPSPIKLNFYSGSQNEGTGASSENLMADTAGHDLVHSRNAQDPKSEEENLKLQFHQDLAEHQYFLENNSEAEVLDPINFNFHRIRLKRKLLATSLKIYQAEMARTEQELKKLQKNHKVVPAYLRARIKQLNKFIRSSKSKYKLVELKWLSTQDVQVTLEYNRLKRENLE